MGTKAYACLSPLPPAMISPPTLGFTSEHLDCGSGNGVSPEGQSPLPLPCTLPSPLPGLNSKGLGLGLGGPNGQSCGCPAQAALPWHSLRD